MSIHSSPETRYEVLDETVCLIRGEEDIFCTVTLTSIKALSLATRNYAICEN